MREPALAEGEVNGCPRARQLFRGKADSFCSQSRRVVAGRRKFVRFGVALGKTFGDGDEHMIKILLTVAVLGSVGSFAGLAMAQGKQGQAVGNEVSSQCAHRRVM